MKKTLTILVNLFIGIMSFGAWLGMFFSAGDGTLSASGFTNLKYFTVLSNLFNGVAAVLYAECLLFGKRITPWLRTLKLTSTAAVGLTFVTVMGFLGPVYGYNTMFIGANFWLHLVLPVGSILSFIILERGVQLPFRYTLWAAVPVVLYEIGYLGNIALHGIGEWPDRNDFYGFLSWGNGVGAVFTIGIVLITWGIAAVLYRMGKVRKVNK